MMQKIGYQGVYGAYSSIASLNYFGENNDFIGYDDFKTMADDLQRGKIDYGVFPVENSTTGQIYRTLDILKYEKDLFAIGETIVEVNHNLIALPNTTVDDLKFVYSHPEALSQCLEFFKKHPHITPVSYEDTAKSVVYIKELNNKENGAIASSLAGKTHNMNILSTSIQDMSGNKTRFLIFKKVLDKSYYFTDTAQNSEKLSCYFETKHEIGALSKILEIFSKQNYNLLSLHSRSTKKNSFEYGFFVDVNINGIDVESLKNLLYKLEDNLLYFNLLGIYNEFKNL